MYLLSVFLIVYRLTLRQTNCPRWPLAKSLVFINNREYVKEVDGAN